MRYRYERISSPPPDGIRWEQDDRDAGQTVDVWTSTTGVWGTGGLDRHGWCPTYRRVTDQSIPTTDPDRIIYYRRVAST